jgi:hypothetical protein
MYETLHQRTIMIEIIIGEERYSSWYQNKKINVPTQSTLDGVFSFSFFFLSLSLSLFFFCLCLSYIHGTEPKNNNTNGLTVADYDVGHEIVWYLMFVLFIKMWHSIHLKMFSVQVLRPT